jgi:phage shock protein A
LSREDRDRDATQKLGKVLASAATAKLNLAVAGVGVLGAAALHSLPVLALAATMYLALVAWDAVTPSFWRKVLMPPRAPPALPDPASLSDEGLRRVVNAVIAARVERARVLTETPEDIRSHLVVAQMTVEELESRVARLVARAEDLAKYLRRMDVAAVRADAERLSSLARRAADAEARTQFEQARAARESQLKNLADIADAGERTFANLSRIVAALEALPVQVVRMRALDGQASESVYGDLNHNLEGMNSEIRVFEDSLKAYEQVGAS